MKTASTRSAPPLLRMLLAAYLAITLGGCGFQLRGTAALPEEMSVVYIKSSNPYGSLVSDFADALRVHHVKVTENREKATAVLHIMQQKQDTAVLSVNASGKVLEYQLRQSIQFDVRTIDNLPLLEPQSVSMTRDYLYSSTDVLSSAREEIVVRRALQLELVNLAILRITAAAR